MKNNIIFIILIIIIIVIIYYLNQNKTQNNTNKTQNNTNKTQNNTNTIQNNNTNTIQNNNTNTTQNTYNNNKGQTTFTGDDRATFKLFSIGNHSFIDFGAKNELKNPFKDSNFAEKDYDSNSNSNKPTGSPTSPTSGAPTSPPTGSPTSPPTGSPTSPPTGSPTSPPSGAPIAPSGTPIAPSGTPIAPSGTPIAPSGTPIAPSGTPIAPSPPSKPCPSGGIGYPNYGTIAKRACDSVKDWKPTTQSDFDLLSGKGSLQNYTATDLAKVWTVSTADLKKKGGQTKNGGTESCSDAITVALGECQAFANPTSPTNGGCSMAISGQGTSGGIWQVSGPLSWNPKTKKISACPFDIQEHPDACGCLTEGCCPKITIGKQEYDCQANYKTPQDFWGSPGPNNFVNTPVCQARLAFIQAQNGCGADTQNNSVPQCNDNTMSANKPGNPCWAGPLCITGQPASLPGVSSANGWTNSYGHYYKSCCKCDGSGCFDGLNNPWGNCGGSISIN
jgi:hypothetical protein